MLKYKIVSDSMSPLIPIGAEIEIRKLVDGEQLKKFDIILFKQDMRLVCHYFWHENKIFDKGMINTRCIKNLDEDHPFARTQVIGVVTNFKIGNWLKFKMIIRDLFR